MALPGSPDWYDVCLAALIALSAAASIGTLAGMPAMLLLVTHAVLIWPACFAGLGAWYGARAWRGGPGRGPAGPRLSTGAGRLAGMAVVMSVPALLFFVNLGSIILYGYLRSLPFTYGDAAALGIEYHAADLLRTCISGFAVAGCAYAAYLAGYPPRLAASLSRIFGIGAAPRGPDAALVILTALALSTAGALFADPGGLSPFLPYAISWCAALGASAGWYAWARGAAGRRARRAEPPGT
ncbi:MAG: hypothetical protein MPJ08_04915 [Nitrosopumilus sp.]|nr:hypothetical protein [Nitrosopumilus sp.]